MGGRTPGAPPLDPPMLILSFKAFKTHNSMINKVFCQFFDHLYLAYVPDGASGSIDLIQSFETL